MDTRRKKDGNNDNSYGDFDFEEFIDSMFSKPKDDDDDDDDEKELPNLGFLGIPKWRHVFDKVLTTHNDGSVVGDEYGGVWIEYWTEEAGTAEEGPNGDGWKPISELGESISAGLLKNECGIRFQAGKFINKVFSKIPYRYSDTEKENWESNFKLRVTATIQLDAPYVTEASDFFAAGGIRGTALAPISPIGLDTQLKDTKVSYVDGSNKFRYRIIHSESRFFNDPKFINVSVNDAWRSVIYARQLYSNWSQATCRGVISIPGLDLLDTSNILGTSAEKIEGKEISFETSPEGASPKRYPTIAGISYDIQRQETKLHLETFRRHQ